MLILVRKLEELKQAKKLKKCGRSQLEKAKKIIRENKCKKPTDRDDTKFVEVALAEEATILTEDHALLSLNPYRCGKINLTILTPNEYLET